MKLTEVETVSEIWLHRNLEAHNFIDKKYWLDHLDEVKEQFKYAKIYVFDNHGIQGFTGLDGEFIAGIFVKKTARHQGVGTKLLNYLKERYPKLTLDVYDKNQSVLQFYKKNDFNILFGDLDKDNNEKYYRMIWTRG